MARAAAKQSVCTAPHRRSRPGVGSLIALALAVWTLAPLAYLLIQAHRWGGSISTGPGFFAADQLQYLSWIRSASEHGLAANGFDLGGGGHVFLQPMFALSGLALRAGSPVAVSFLVWTPVAAVALFIGCRAYVTRLVAPGPARAAALVLALFYVSPADPVAGWGSRAPGELAALAGELFPAGTLWGYLPIALTIGLMPLFLLGLERILAPSPRAPGRGAHWHLGWTCVAGLFVSWLHPWQGETLLLVVAVLVVWGRLWGRWKVLAAPVLATALPLAYYFALSRSDEAWRHAQAQTPLGRPGVVAFVLALGPLALLAAVGGRKRTLDLQERMLIAWPVASVVLCFLLATAYPPHALEGLSLPLAILAVRGWGRLHLHPALAAVVIVALTVPGMVYTARLFKRTVDSGAQPFILRAPELRALGFLDGSPVAGGVLPSVRIAAVVPGYTGRRAWLGHQIWTPDYARRARAADALFAGRLSAGDAQSLVVRTGVRYLLSGCEAPRDLTSLLGRLLVKRRAFGCASVYEVRTSAPAPGRL